MTAIALASGAGSTARLLADDDTGKGSPIGLFILLALLVAVWFLYRSMSKHLKRVPTSFDPPPERSPAPPSAQPAQSAPSAQSAPPAQSAQALQSSSAAGDASSGAQLPPDPANTEGRTGPSV